MKYFSFKKLGMRLPLKFTRKIKQQLTQLCLLCHSEKANSNVTHSDFCFACAVQFPRNLICCRRCASPLENAHITELICGQCQQHPPSFDRTLATFRYEYPINKLITAFKYQRRLELIPALAQEIKNDIETIYNFSDSKDASRPDAIIPIPLHRFREFKRGYNQVSLLAKYLATEFNIPLLENILIRKKNTHTQATLNKKQRQKNLRKAFVFNPKKLNHRLKHIVLIDDVMTTGSTLEAASQVCRKVGIERIDVWCCARAEL